MTQTLRRELRKKVFDYLEKWYQDNPPTEDARKYNAERADDIADIVLEVSAIAKRAEISKAGVDWAILAGEKVSEDVQNANRLEEEAINAF